MEKNKLPAVVFTADNLQKVKIQDKVENESKYDVGKGDDSGKLFRFKNKICLHVRLCISVQIYYCIHDYFRSVLFSPFFTCN